MSDASIRIDVTSEDGKTIACTMQARAGALLVDACDAYRAPIEFSCRAACCSTCRVRVVYGYELLAEPDEFERELIQASGGDAGIRFCCAAKLASDAPLGSTVILQPLGPAF